MQSHRAVEILLGRPHPNGDGSHLDNFSRMLTNHVASENLAARSFKHKLEQTPGPALRQSLSHGAEAGTMHGDRLFAKTLDCYFLTEPNRCELRLTEHSTGNEVVIHLSMTTGKGEIGVSTPFIHRHRSEADAICHITNGVDVGPVRGLIGINRNAVAIHHHSRCAQIEPFKERASPGSKKHTTTTNRLTLTGDNSELTGLTFNCLRTDLEADLDTVLLHPLLDNRGQLPVKATQQMVATHELNHLHPKPLEDAGKFAGDEAASNHNNPRRKTVLKEHVITHPSQCSTGISGR